MDSRVLKFASFIGGLAFPVLQLALIKLIWGENLNQYLVLFVLVASVVVSSWGFARWREMSRKKAGIKPEPADRRSFEGAEIWFRYASLAGVYVSLNWPAGGL